MNSRLRRFKIKGRIVIVLLAGLSLHLVLMLVIFNFYSYTYLQKICTAMSFRRSARLD